MYADSAYYTGEFLGAVIPAEQLDVALECASDLVDVVTLGRVADYGFASLTAFQQAKIKRACCILAEDVFAPGALTSGVPSLEVSAWATCQSRNRETP